MTMLEVATRTTLYFKYDCPFFTPRDILYTYYYPEVKPVLHASPEKEPNTFRVLLLGASVLLPSYGTIEIELRNKLKQAYPTKKIIIFNVSAPAHTSLDSRFKYQLLSKHRFDAVIFYHGINETRANNCPPDVFRSNYTHYAFYQETHLLMRHPEMNYCTLPYFLELVFLKISNKLNHHKLVPTHAPQPDWLQYGKIFKTGPAFANNIQAIINLAKRKKEKLLLLGYAYYVPTNYSLAGFLNKTLDYQTHNSPIELWGLPPHVANSIDGHNQMLQRLVQNNSEVLYYDMNAIIPKNKHYFNDICHLTNRGCNLFAEKVVLTLIEN